MRDAFRCDPVSRSRGFSVLELLLMLAVSAAVIAVAVPSFALAADEARTAAAARYLEARIMDARMYAVRRSARVGFRFDSPGQDVGFAEYVDGNGNGVRSAEITAGIDPLRTLRQHLRAAFSGVTFRLPAGLPDVDDVRTFGGEDGVRVGASRILTLGPDGTATSGTLYLRGRHAQYAVRIFGATGRTRVLRFVPATGQWISR
jgi:type II secretory pathway pseudopilin PulG